MKKILLVLFVVLTGLILTGCVDTISETNGVRELALVYAEETYYYGGEGGILLGYTIEEYSLYELDNEYIDFEEYKWECYRVDFIDEFARNYVFSVLIVYEEPVSKIVSEDNVIDVIIKRG